MRIEQMMTMQHEQIGETLDNGAIILAASDNGAILCYWDGHGFITWMRAKDGSTYWGHYFGDTADDLIAASVDFRARAVK